VFQENSDDEADERSIKEYLRDLDVEYQERALLANSKRFIKRRNNFLAKETWTDLVHSFEGPSDTKENRIIDLKLEYQTFMAKYTEILSQINTHYKTLLNELANDGVNLFKHKINVFQENSDDEADERSSKEYLRDLDVEYKERALLAKSKRFIKRRNNFLGRSHYVKVLMTLAHNELTVRKSHARNGEWVDITIRKVNTLLFMDEDADWQNYLKKPLGSFSKLRGNAIDLSTSLSKRETMLRQFMLFEALVKKRAPFEVSDDMSITYTSFLLGYSSVSKDFRVYNTRRQQIEETYHVTFVEIMEAIRFTNISVDEIGIDDSSRYPPDEEGMLTRSMVAKLIAALASECLFVDFLSEIEPKKVFERDSVSPPPLAAKPKKGNSYTMTSTLPKSHGLEASRALSKKSKRPKSKKLPIKTMVTLPKLTEGYEQSHSWGQRLRGNKPPANMELQNLMDTDLLRTGAKKTNPLHLLLYTLKHPKWILQVIKSSRKKPKEPKQSTDANIEFTGSSTHPPSITQAQPITIIHLKPSVPQREGKEIQEYWDKEEEIKKAKEEARLNAISKTEAITTKSGELFKKAQDAKHETVSSRLKPEPITDIKIHPKSKPVVITIFRGIDGRNFNVHKPFLFRAFRISELNELREIIPNGKNGVVKDLMNSLSRRYERLRQIPGELRIQSALPASEQAPSQTSGRKWKHMELKPETRNPGLECNRALPENVSFIDKMVIEKPEYGIFFTDKFGDQAF
nr:retrovirus-related Pol polyprotein from transposon TNT 1-94 [Tanacetum cinerariifolium]